MDEVKAEHKLTALKLLQGDSETLEERLAVALQQAEESGAVKYKQHLNDIGAGGFLNK